MKKYFRILLSALVISTSFFLSPQSLFAQQTATSTDGLSDQHFTTVNVIDELFQDKAYVIGDTVNGSFVLKNTNTYDVPEVYYVMSILTGFDENTLKAKGQFGDTERQGPIFVSKNSDKTINFSYKIPQFFDNTQKGEKIVLHVEAYSSSGVRMGWFDKEIKIENLTKQLAEVFNTSIEVNNKEFTPKQGPTVLDGQKANFNVVLYNSSSSDVTIFPEITIHDRQPSTPVIGNKTYDPIVLPAGLYVEESFELPQFDNFKGVYAGKFRFTDGKDNDVAEGVYLRYIVGEDYGTIQSVTIDKTSVAEGDIFNSSVVYTGPATNINTSQPTLGEGTMNVSITNEKGEIVASSTQNIALDTNTDNKTVNFNLEAQRDASQLFVSVIMKKDNQILATYSSRLTDPEKVLPKQSQNFSLYIIAAILFGIIILIILIALFLKMKKRNTIMFLALGSLFVGGMFAPGHASAALYALSINSPYDGQQVNAGATFSSSGSGGIKVCGNESANFTLSLGFQGQGRSGSCSMASHSSCSDKRVCDSHGHNCHTKQVCQGDENFYNLPCSVGTTFTAPQVPGSYKLYLSYGASFSAGWGNASESGSTFVNVNVVCPTGTTCANSPVPLQSLTGGGGGNATTTSICTPKLACSGTKITDGCNPDIDCQAVNGAGSTCSPTTLTCTKSAAQIYIDTNGGTNLPSGQVVIKDFKANTINPYNSTNGTGGNCSPVFNLLTEDKYSTCTITGSAQGDQTYTYPIVTPKTLSDSKVKSETQYKLTCGENLPDPKTGATTTLTGTSTKYATCYINASFSEVNP